MGPESREQKWFVYRGDRHEGPYSKEHVLFKIDEGSLTSADFAWTQGMPDWELLENLPGFIPTDSAPNASPDAPSSAPWAPSRAPLSTTLQRHIARKSEIAAAVPRSFSSKPAQRARVRARVASIMLGLSIAAVAAGAWVKRGALRDSEIPKLQDVSSSEYQLLWAAAHEPLSGLGGALAVAISKVNSLTPSFYIATNLPDGARFDVQIDGIAGTLLGKTRFSRKITLTVNHRLAKTPPFHQIDGGTLSRGEYRVLAYEAADQAPPVAKELARMPTPGPTLGLAAPAAKLVAQKVYFLGGPRDADYARALAEYHGRVRGQAQSEIGDLKQFAASIEDQLEQSSSEFEKVATGSDHSVRGRQERWERFDRQWSAFQDQMDQIVGKWTPQAIDTFFYDELYGLTQQANEQVKQIHAQQGVYLKGASADEALKTRLASAESITQSAILSLKDKIRLEEQMLDHSSDFPQK